MSNSFPTMFSSEPPPLDQSDDDEDSEEFRDFSSGLKFDIDPSPMSTPRKSKLDNLPIPNGSLDSTVVEESSPKNEFDGGNNNNMCVSESTASNVMKTSYIGTLETVVNVEQEQGQTLHSPEKIIENHVMSNNCSPPSPPKCCETPSNFHSLTDHDDDDDDDFDEFQDFQTNVTTTMDKVNSEDDMEGSQNLSQNDKSGNDEESSELHKEEEQLSVEDSESLSSSMPKDDHESPTVVIPPSHDELNNFVDASSNFEFENKLDSPTKIIVEESECIQADCPPPPSSSSSSSSPPPPTAVPEADDSFNENFSAFQAAVDNVDDDEFDNFQEFQAPQQASSQEADIIVSSGKVDCVQSPLPMNQSSSALQDSTEPDSTNNLNLDTVVPSLDTQHQEQVTRDIPQSNNHQNCQEETPSSNFQSFQDDDDDDFEDFQAFEPVQQPIPQQPTTTNSVSAPLPVPSNANFHNNNNVPVTPVMFPPPPQMNFEDFSTAGPAARKSLLMENKFESIVKSLFVIAPGSGGTDDDEPTSSLKPIDKELKEDNDNEEWSRVEDFEGSQGLLFKWLNSVAYEKLLHSLKIDKSSIVYTNKWGPIEVPRFAASLVDSPLLPESSGATTTASKQQGDVVHKNNNTVKSDAIKSPSSENDCSHGQGSSGQLSQEAEQILSQLPDLSFMRAKTLVFPNNVLDAQAVARTRDV